MSKKTIKQRIAVVAVSALTAGVLSVASAPVASAATTLAVATSVTTGVACVPHATVGSANSTAIIKAVSGSGTAQVATMAVGQTIAISTGTPASLSGILTVSGGTITSTTAATATLDYFNGSNFAGDTAGFGVCITPLAAGTPMVVSVYDTATASTSTAGGTLTGQLTVTVVASSSVNVFSPGHSSQTFSVQDTSNTATYSNVAAVGGSYVDQSEAAGIITGKVFDANGVQLTNVIVQADANNAVVALNSVTSTAFLGTSTAGTDADGAFYIAVARPATGAALPSTTVTVKVNGVLLGTQVLTFVGEAASVKISGVKSQTTTAGSLSKTDSYTYDVLDALGNKLIAAAIAADTSRYNSSVGSMSVGNTAALGAASNDEGWTCTGIAGTAKLRVYALKADGITKVYSPEFTAACYGDAYSYSASFDKASYVPGDVATLTISAKDSTGNPANDYSVLGGAGADTVAIAGSNMTAVSAPTNTDKFSGGVATYKYIVGSTGGSYQMSVSLPLINTANSAQSSLTVPYKITTSGTTNEDVLKSIVALIASINKQIQALQKLILKR